MSEQFKALQGFKDILPDEQPYWRMVERVAIEAANLYGYRRIETPILEETALFARTSGEGTDVVEKEMYSFDDRPDKEGNSTNLTLRPEGTAGTVRAYLEHGMFQQAQPVKLYYLSEPMFRHEKPQAGRVREHHQFGCEALGDGDPAIDAEMIALLYDFYAHLGLKNIRVFINSIGDGNCRPQYIEILKDYYRPLLNESCQDCQVRFYKNPLRLLDCKEPQDQPKIAAAPKIIDYLCEPCHLRSSIQYPIGSCIFPSSEEKKNSTTQREVSVILSHIISYPRLAIVTKSVTKRQTSATLASDAIFVIQRFRVFRHADQVFVMRSLDLAPGTML
jgi:histidyl-tRNA synthetase